MYYDPNKLSDRTFVRDTLKRLIEDKNIALVGHAIVAYVLEREDPKREWTYPPADAYAVEFIINGFLPDEHRRVISHANSRLDDYSEIGLSNLISTRSTPNLDDLKASRRSDRLYKNTAFSVLHLEDAMILSALTGLPVFQLIETVYK